MFFFFFFFAAVLVYARLLARNKQVRLLRGGLRDVFASGPNVCSTEGLFACCRSKMTVERVSLGSRCDDADGGDGCIAVDRRATPKITYTSNM
jgi:hypothetical protein